MPARIFARVLLLLLIAQPVAISQAADDARHVALGSEPQPTVYLWLKLVAFAHLSTDKAGIDKA